MRTLESRVKDMKLTAKRKEEECEDLEIAFEEELGSLRALLSAKIIKINDLQKQLQKQKQLPTRRKALCEGCAKSSSEKIELFKKLLENEQTIKLQNKVASKL